MISTNDIDLTIVTLADENHMIKNPSSVIAQHMGIDESQVRSRVKFLKTQKLIYTKSNGNGSEYTQLVVSDELMSRVYDPNKRIWMLVDLENIKIAEQTSPKRISYYGLKNYALKFGRVFQAEVYAPHHYLDPAHALDINYFNHYDWKVVICGKVKKDKDLVDHRIKRQVSDISHYFPEDHIWIVSRDSDFLEDLNRNRFRGKNNIRLIDPFTIPNILGYEEQEMKSALSRSVLNIMECMKTLTPTVMDSETHEQRLIRYSAGWFLKLPTPVVNFHNHKACVEQLYDFLNSKIHKRLKVYSDFPKYAIRAYQEVGMICEMDTNRQSYQLLINREHEMFPIVAPPHFIYGAMSG